MLADSGRPIPLKLAVEAALALAQAALSAPGQNWVTVGADVLPKTILLRFSRLS